MFRNLMPRYDVLSEDALEMLDGGWRRIVSEIGLEIHDEAALGVFRRAGQRVDDTRVRFDPEWLEARVASAPSSFTWRARSEARSVTVGGDSMVFVASYGIPFVWHDGERREATYKDFQEYVRLAHAFGELDSAGGTIVEPTDLPPDSRHLDMVLALQCLSDKPYMGSVTSATSAADSIEMTKILFGEEELSQPSVIALVNVNSPLLFDTRMLESLQVYAAARQPVIITPALFMGAMAPVSLAAALSQSLAEGLVGVALTQEISPGTPVVFGAFISNTDMKSGSPAMGTPESALGLLAGGQIARRLNIPFRAGGGACTTSKLADAQAGYEAVMMMMPAFLAGANLVMHTAGWLEGGLAASTAKFAVDIEIVRMLQETFRPITVDEASLAWSAYEEVGPGGYFFGAAHTLERFRDCFYRPLVSSTANFERWRSQGRPDAAARAETVAQEALERYVEPELDDERADALSRYVARRRTELGD